MTKGLRPVELLQLAPLAAIPPDERRDEEQTDNHFG